MLKNTSKSLVYATLSCGHINHSRRHSRAPHRTSCFDLSCRTVVKPLKRVAYCLSILLRHIVLNDEPVGSISHMGANTACGHYMAHVRKCGQWAVFNGEKVRLEQSTTLALQSSYLGEGAQCRCSSAARHTALPH